MFFSNAEHKKRLARIEPTGESYRATTAALKLFSH